MRKIDYSILAALIARETKRHCAACECAINPIDFARADGAFKSLESLAHSFARHACVDRQLFIMECGL